MSLVSPSLMGTVHVDDCARIKNMSKIDYEDLKKFLGFFYEWFFASPSSKPESHPFVAAKAIEAKSMAQARRGLDMAINDCVEYSSEWGAEVVALVDKRLLLHGAPSLSEVRAKYSRKYLQVLKRGSIKSLKEYYLVKGVVDGGGIEPGAGEAEKLIAMLDEYEQRLPPRTEG